MQVPPEATQGRISHQRSVLKLSAECFWALCLYMSGSTWLVVEKRFSLPQFLRMLSGLHIVSDICVQLGQHKLKPFLLLCPAATCPTTALAVLM